MKFYRGTFLHRATGLVPLRRNRPPRIGGGFFNLSIARRCAGGSYLWPIALTWLIAQPSPSIAQPNLLCSNASQDRPAGCSQSALANDQAQTADNSSRFIIASALSGDRAAIADAPPADHHASNSSSSVEPIITPKLIAPSNYDRVAQTACGNGICNSSQTCVVVNGRASCAPKGSTACGNGICNSSQTCVVVNNGASCQPQGSTACGNGICNSSQTCVVVNNGASCQPKGSFACGNGICNSSQTCLTVSGRATCQPQGSTQCGNGICNSSQTCVVTNNGGSCQPKGSTACGNGICNSSQTCVVTNNGGSCQPKGSTACGNGICNPTQKCLIVSGRAVCAAN